MRLHAEKELEGMHNHLKTLITETGREIVEEGVDKENDLWVVKMKHGIYIVLLLHPLKQKYVVIRFVFELDEEHRNLLKEHFADPIKVNEIVYGLSSAISSPYTARTLRTVDCENGQKLAVGFEVDAKAFPLDKAFTITHFDNAVQSVVSLGVLGITFIASLLQLGEMAIKQQEVMSTSSPDGMFL